MCYSPKTMTAHCVGKAYSLSVCMCVCGLYVHICMHVFVNVICECAVQVSVAVTGLTPRCLLQLLFYLLFETEPLSEPH